VHALAFLAQSPDGGAEFEFDAVGLLKALLEQGMSERGVLRPAGCGEECRQAGGELGVFGSEATSTRCLMPATATLSKAAMRRANRSVNSSSSASGATRFT